MKSQAPTKAVPALSGNRFFGPLVAESRRDPLGFMARLARECGDVCSFRAGLEHVFFVNHPDYVRQVLVNHYDNFLKGKGRQRAKKLVIRILRPLIGVAHARRARLRIVNPNPLKWEAPNPNRHHTR